jgi:hypothetical protein
MDIANRKVAHIAEIQNGHFANVLAPREKEIRRPAEGNPGLSVWVRTGEQDGENLGRRKGMGASGWDGTPANKCKMDWEALPGSAVRFCAGGTGWSPGRRGGSLMCAGGGRGGAAKERVIHLASPEFGV